MNMKEAIQAKSDQLNAVDITGYEPVIKITDVKMHESDQPVSVHYEGDRGRPWKPSKGMLRVLTAGWGLDEKKWTGKTVKIYCDPTVMYGPNEAGGIRICAMSDIPS